MILKYEIEEIFVENIANLLFNHDDIIKIGVAVSGGSDSIGLLQLTHEWCQRNKAEIRLYVLSVNHNLRSESLNECSYVKAFAQQMGYECFVLNWIHLYTLECGVQETARKNRYELLAQECKKLGIKILFTGHHFDDMLETFYMRKKRKAGVLGLSSSYVYFVNDIRIVRPLYNITKKAIQNYLIENKIQWREDPSNDLIHYERNKVRKQLAELTEAEIQALKQEMLQINHNSNLLNQKFIIALAECVIFNDLGFAIINIHLFLNLNSELKIYVMNHVVCMVNGSEQCPRYRNVQKVISQLHMNASIKITCHFCVIETVDGQIVVYREYDKISHDILLLQNKTIIWDNRFSITSELVYQDMYVTFMDNSEAAQYIYNLCIMKSCAFLLEKFNKKLVRNIIMTVPIIKLDKKIIAIPSLSYYTMSQFRAGLNVLFKPQMVSRFTHFI